MHYTTHHLMHKLANTKVLTFVLSNPICNWIHICAMIMITLV